MCVIMNKPMGVRAPEKNVFQAMFSSNPDGAGYMWADGKNVYIRKGFMTFEDFWSDYLCNKNDDLAYVFHFRIGTSGGNLPCNTHPFPITESDGSLKALTYKSKVAVCHNGIITCDIEHGLSDTMTYIKHTLFPMSKVFEKFYNNKWFDKIIYDQTGSKWSFLNSDGEITTIGMFQEDEHAPGCTFSNLSWGWRFKYNFDTTANYPYYKSYGYQSDYSETYEENKDKYMQTRIMWCDEDYDTAYNPETGEMYVGYFGIDALGDVVTYDCNLNCVVHFDGLIMIDRNGSTIEYGARGYEKNYSWEIDYNFTSDIREYLATDADSSLVYEYATKPIDGQVSLSDIASESDSTRSDTL